MSHIQPGPPRVIGSWDDLNEWLVDAFEALDIGDVFDLGPHDPHIDEAKDFVPCAQAMALDGGVVLRLSTSAMGIPLLRDRTVEKITLDVWRRGTIFDDCTFGYVVSADFKFLASACVNWFRDKHNLDFRRLGCELTKAVSLQGPRGIPPSERY